MGGYYFNYIYSPTYPFWYISLDREFCTYFVWLHFESR